MKKMMTVTMVAVVLAAGITWAAEPPKMKMTHWVYANKLNTDSPLQTDGGLPYYCAASDQSPG